MTAAHVVAEAEELVQDYPPGGPIPDNDIVPEPATANYLYAENAAFLVPPRLSDMTLEELRPYFEAKMVLLRTPEGTRGVITTLGRRGQENRCTVQYASWYTTVRGSQRRNCVFRVSNEPPPYDADAVRKWLREHGIRLSIDKRKRAETWTILAFEDEWCARGQTRPAWIAVRSLGNRVEMVRCFTVRTDDYLFRTPFGSRLSDKTAVVVGCGSLGSTVATALSQEGLGILVLVDHDVFEPGNAVRNQVGAPWQGIAKTLALRARIAELAPACTVIPLTATVGHFDRGPGAFQSSLEKADIVVDTTGHHGVAHLLNRMCVRLHKPLVVASVTNGVWSAEVFRYRPGVSGCWVCWLKKYGHQDPPGAPVGSLQFAPGCNQPTFVGGAADIMVSAGLVARMVTETLVTSEHDSDYLVLTNRSQTERWEPHVQYYTVDRDPGCPICSL